jgi:selenocysteine lyase/cysteine desulfurase
LVDAAQAVGEVAIDVQTLGVAMLAFPGHKGLLGPQGCGGLYVRSDIELAAWREGGTGTQSKLTEHPHEMPHHLEAGTHNLPAIAGLAAGVRFIQERGIGELRGHQLRLLRRLLDGLGAIDRVALYGDIVPERRCGVVSFNIAGMECSDVGAILDQSFDIAVRTGLHCAAPTHRAIGTFPSGTVRASPGFATTEDEIQTFLDAIEQIADAAL